MKFSRNHFKKERVLECLWNSYQFATFEHFFQVSAHVRLMWFSSKPYSYHFYLKPATVFSLCVYRLFPCTRISVFFYV